LLLIGRFGTLPPLSFQHVDQNTIEQDSSSNGTITARS